MLKISNLNIWAGNNELINGVSLNIKMGEIHALMGPNASGKTSLALGLMGHPNYKVTKGNIFLDNKNITFLTPEKRAKLGLFVSFQSPIGVEGVSLGRYLLEAKKGVSGKTNLDIESFYDQLILDIKDLSLPENFLDRPVNYGASGGERKKIEILSLINLKPKYVIFDEIDTGLDVDALKLIAGEIKNISKNSGLIIITHYQRILKFVRPDFVHIVKHGKLVCSGDYKMADVIERRGYAAFN